MTVTQTKQVSAQRADSGGSLVAAVLQDDHTRNALFYCLLLALQFGLQPMIASKFTASGVSKSSVVIMTELMKIAIAAVYAVVGGAAEWEKLRETWTVADSLRVAALPATLYAIQNLLVQYGYVLLDSMTFNLLNQTKTLSAAFWLWMLLGQPQSWVQVGALMLLLVAAILLNFKGGATSAAVASYSSYNLGLTLVAVASLLSGLSAALTQRALVGAKPRPAVFFSAELAVYGIAFLLLNLLFNNDVQGGGFALLTNWSWLTLVPVTTNALGGIVVGQVTKYAGGVVKGFALIAGLIVTGIAQWMVDGKPLGSKDLVAMLLVSVSIYLHAKFPAPRTPEADKKSK